MSGIGEGRPCPDFATGDIVTAYAAARRDSAFAVLEGLHAIKHGLRFGAEFESIVSRDARAIERLAEALAPDIRARLMAQLRVVSEADFLALSPTPPDTGIIAVARRRMSSIDSVIRAAPAVWLEDPSNIGNIGAAVRAAAAAGAAAVMTTGMHDPWHPAALRGSAGLHYALPVFRVSDVDTRGRRLVAIDGEGEPLSIGSLPTNAIYAFGSERRGISDALRSRADAVVAIPMEPGVSSLNLATAVAVALYIWRLGVDARR